VSGWRSKLVFLLIVYFAGFATAIYTLAPAPANSKQFALGALVSPGSGHGEQLTSEQFVESFNAGMHKCIDFGKAAALRTGKLIRKKLKEMPKK
jgi:hypothetical protein